MALEKLVVCSPIVFFNIGKKVLLSDETNLNSELELLANSDMVIVSIPIEKTPQVIRRISSKIKPTQILSDFTSVKSNVIPEMQKTLGSIISVHPMFSEIQNMAGQKIILLPVRENGHLQELELLYQKLGLNTVIIEDWKQHDKYMSLIQGLLHFIQITFAQTIRQHGLSLDVILSICSPIYFIYFSIVCRIFHLDPGFITLIFLWIILTVLI